MKKLLLWTAFCFIGTTGCMVEEQGCATNEDCGDKWVCDPATGACIPAEESDADFAGSDLSLPEADDAATGDDFSSASDSSDQTDVSDVSYDADTVTDTDTFSDKDALVTDGDVVTDADIPDGSDASDVTSDTDTVTDAVPDIMPDTAVDEDVPATDEIPDSDAACSDCSCPDYCNGHGSCSEQYGYPECTCDTGYAGSWCQQCDYAWQDHDGDGICEKDDCAHATAPGTGWLDCGDHGVCDDWGGDVPADCDCDTYWVDMNGECDYCFASDPNDC